MDELISSLKHIHLLVKARLWAQILIAMIVGIIVGLVLSPSMNTALSISKESSEILGDWLRMPGKIFLNLIQMVVIPLIATSIILGITSAGDPSFLRKVATRIIPYFVTTTIIAVLIGSFSAFLFQPGSFVDPKSLNIETSTKSVELDNLEESNKKSIPTQIAELIPSNLAQAELSQNMMQIVIATILIGVAIISLGLDRMEPILKLLSVIQELVLKIVGWAMLLAPLAVFGLIADFVLRVGLSALVGMSMYIAAVICGLFALFITYLLIVKFLGKRNPISFAKNVSSAQLLAFSTSSSAATMPLSLETAEEKLKISPPVAKFIIPLGATVNMDGTALYQVVAALFMSQLYGIELAPAALATLMVTVVGASIGSPSTPGVGIVILATILQSIGIPASGVAVLLGVDRILDMCRTSINVTGDLTACVVMDRLLARDFKT